MCNMKNLTLRIEEDILAIAYYVNSLVELGKNDSAGAHKLRDDLRASLATAWVAPVAEEDEDSGEPDTEAVGCEPRPILEPQPPTLGVDCCHSDVSASRLKIG